MLTARFVVHSLRTRHRTEQLLCLHSQPADKHYGSDTVHWMGG